jgi:hypothetical protein
MNKKIGFVFSMSQSAKFSIISFQIRDYVNLARPKIGFAFSNRPISKPTRFVIAKPEGLWQSSVL